MLAICPAGLILLKQILLSHSNSKKQDEEFRAKLNCFRVINLHIQLFWAYEALPELVIY